MKIASYAKFCLLFSVIVCDISRVFSNLKLRKKTGYLGCLNSTNTKPRIYFLDDYLQNFI